MEVHRIWSTDWFMHKEEEVNRTLAAYRNAVRSADDSDQRDGSSAVPKRPDNPVPPSPDSGRAPSRRARPNFEKREAITDYSEPELVALVNWIDPMVVVRTDDQIIEELLPELGSTGEELASKARCFLYCKSAALDHRTRVSSNPDSATSYYVLIRMTDSPFPC